MLVLLQKPRSSSCREKTSGWSYMIFITWLCCSCIISTVVPMFNLKGRQSISALKSKSGDSTSRLGPKYGFSLEVGGSISGVTISTCSVLTLMELGATGEKDIWMLSPSLSMLALCSILWPDWCQTILQPTRVAGSTHSACRCWQEWQAHSLPL